MTTVARSLREVETYETAFRDQPITPVLNFPIYVEREWFGVQLPKVVAYVFERRQGALFRKHDEAAHADGILACVPLIYGPGMYVVRYYRMTATGEARQQRQVTLIVAPGVAIGQPMTAVIQGTQ